MFLFIFENVISNHLDVPYLCKVFLSFFRLNCFELFLFTITNNVKMNSLI